MLQHGGNRAWLGAGRAADDHHSQGLRSFRPAKHLQYGAGQGVVLRGQSEKLRERERFALLEVERQPMAQGLPRTRAQKSLDPRDRLEGPSNGFSCHVESGGLAHAGLRDSTLARRSVMDNKEVQQSQEALFGVIADNFRGRCRGELAPRSDKALGANRGFLN